MTLALWVVLIAAGFVGMALGTAQRLIVNLNHFMERH